VKKRLDEGFPLLWSIPEEGIGYDGTFALHFSDDEDDGHLQNKSLMHGHPGFSDLMAGYWVYDPTPCGQQTLW